MNVSGVDSDASPLNVRTRVALTGVGASPGVVGGPALVLRPRRYSLEERPISPDAIDAELQRLSVAIEKTRLQIESLKNDLDRCEHGASILDAHLMVLDDPDFHNKIRGRIVKRLCNIEVVVHEVADEYIQVLAKVEDAYLRERAVDLRDVSRRIVRNLHGHADSLPTEIVYPCILVAPELTPSETVALPRDRIMGIALDRGSATAHTALIARALEIPAVVGLRDVSARISTGETILMDANRGVVLLRPTDGDTEHYLRLAASRHDIEIALESLRDERAETSDGHGIRLLANIEDVSELEAVRANGAEGVGLFRTEYLWMTGYRDASEEKQFEVYGRAARELNGQPLIIRVLDLGGDKFVEHSEDYQQEPNPFLGLRAIRYLLRHPDVFRTQLRAILRAGALGDVHLLYPMISDVSEILEANALLKVCGAELAAEGLPYNPEMKVGVMIEIPSAALTAAELARHADFFCIGTNDLVQYTLAVDRSNENVAHLYRPAHPSVLRLIHETVKAGHARGLWVGVCGEAAADPLLVALLVGLGVDELSVAPPAVPAVKDALRKVSYKDARLLGEAALRDQSVEAVLDRCRKLLSEVAPELLELM